MSCALIIQVNHTGGLLPFLEKTLYTGGKSHAIQFLL